jgi:predicted nucleotidyltransferase component of viral defense system
VREYWEMLILKELTESLLGEKLVFIGGTALRLVYNSPRFSDDLDFYLKKENLF